MRVSEGAATLLQLLGLIAKLSEVGLKNVH